MKRLMLGLLVCMLLCGLGCLQAIAEELYTCGNFLYTLNDEGNAVITGYTGTEKWLTVTGCVGLERGTDEDEDEPLLLDGHPIAAIGEGAFAGCESLVYLDLLYLDYVGEGAFANCPNLYSVEMQDVTRIGDKAFVACAALDYLNIEEGVLDIGLSAFGDCTALEYISLYESNDLQYIGAYAFANCTALREVWDRYPDSEYVIGVGAFSGCSALERVCLPGMAGIEEYAFSNCENLEWMMIPERVTDIGENAFAGCGEFFAAVAGGSYAEQYCKEADIATDTQGYGYDYAIIGDDNWLSFQYVGDGGGVVIPSEMFGLPVTSVDEGAFYRCKALQTVVIPEGVVSISLGAFDECTALEKVVLPYGLQSIGTASFFRCLSLKHVEIPETVTSVWWDAFCGCTSLETVVMPASVTEICDDVFNNCSSLRTIYVQRGSYAEQYCIENNLSYAYYGEYPVGEICRIGADSARVRSGAGTEFEVVGTVAQGEQYEVRGILPASNGKTWYQIKKDGVLCWISSGICTVD